MGKSIATLQCYMQCGVQVYSMLMYYMVID